MSMDLTLDDGRSAFAPGQAITGQVRWQLDQAPAWIELRLFWYTQGKGTQDVGVALRERYDHPQMSDTRSFNLAAPAQPPSCSGRLVSVCWALELVSSDDQHVPRIDLVIGPEAREIHLGHVE